MCSTLEIREMHPDEAAAVSALVMESFKEFVAPEFSAEGVRSFSEFAAPERIVERNKEGHSTYVADSDTGLVGMIQLQCPDHIRMLFVRPTDLRRGVGGQLINRVLHEIRERWPEVRRVTVNSSSFAVGAYRHLGFEIAGGKLEDGGVFCVPMQRVIGSLPPV